MFMFGEGGRETADQRHRLRRRPGAVRQPVPGVAVLAERTVSTPERSIVSRPVYKALHRPLTVCGVDRRLFFMALLMGTAMFNLFYSFLGRAAHVRGPVRLRLLGHQTRPADAAHPAVIVPIPRSLRRGEARPRRHRGARMLNVRRIRRAYREAGSLNSLLVALGLCRRPHLPHEGGTCRSGLSHRGDGLRGVGSLAAARARAPVRSRVAAAR